MRRVILVYIILPFNNRPTFRAILFRNFRMIKVRHYTKDNNVVTLFTYTLFLYRWISVFFVKQLLRFTSNSLQNLLSHSRNWTYGDLRCHPQWSLLSFPIIQRNGPLTTWTNNANVLWDNAPFPDSTSRGPSLALARPPAMARKYGTRSNKCATCNTPFIHYGKWLKTGVSILRSMDKRKYFSDMWAKTLTGEKIEEICQIEIIWC